MRRQKFCAPFAPLCRPLPRPLLLSPVKYLWSCARVVLFSYVLCTDRLKKPILPVTAFRSNRIWWCPRLSSSPRHSTLKTINCHVELRFGACTIKRTYAIGCWCQEVQRVVLNSNVHNLPDTTPSDVIYIGRSHCRDHWIHGFKV